MSEFCDESSRHEVEPAKLSVTVSRSFGRFFNPSITLQTKSPSPLAIAIVPALLRLISKPAVNSNR
ncbi:MAG TPA: hypothetical protein VF692_13985, partial [Pyrinomonadaceae bacterium]